MGLVLRFSIGRSPRQSGPSALSRLYLRFRPFVANRWHGWTGRQWRPRFFAVTEDWFGLLDFSRGHFRAASLVRWRVSSFGRSDYGGRFMTRHSQHAGDR
jgi:hypothetical protein